MRNSEPGTISYEIPLSEPFLTHDQFAPYRSDWELYRASAGGGYSLLEGGIITDVNLSTNRDSVLVNGKSWLHYLERRMYPFDPVAYVSGHDWVNWPKQWPIKEADVRVDLQVIVEEILLAMMEADRPNSLPIKFSNIPTGSLGEHIIYPGDQTTIFEHVQTLSGLEDGFEFDILPGSLEFKMYAPGRDVGSPIYSLWISDQEVNGAVLLADWTNSGPKSTWFIGYGAGSKIKKGSISTYPPSAALYRRLERAEDFGEVSSQDMMNRLSASQGFQDRFPQKKLSLELLNPEYLTPNFYLGGRPRSLIGQRIHFQFDFANYHKVNADYLVIGITWNVDQSTNETVEFELEMMNDPNTTGLEGTTPHQ